MRWACNACEMNGALENVGRVQSQFGATCNTRLQQRYQLHSNSTHLHRMQTKTGVCGPAQYLSIEGQRLVCKSSVDCTGPYKNGCCSLMVAKATRTAFALCQPSFAAPHDVTLVDNQPRVGIPIWFCLVSFRAPGSWKSHTKKVWKVHINRVVLAITHPVPRLVAHEAVRIRPVLSVQRDHIPNLDLDALHTLFRGIVHQVAGAKLWARQVKHHRHATAMLGGHL